MGSLPQPAVLVGAAGGVMSAANHVWFFAGTAIPALAVHAVDHDRALQIAAPHMAGLGDIDYRPGTSLDCREGLRQPLTEAWQAARSAAAAAAAKPIDEALQWGRGAWSAREQRELEARRSTAVGAAVTAVGPAPLEQDLEWIWMHGRGLVTSLVLVGGAA